jgi:hypothetical protein
MRINSLQGQYWSGCSTLYANVTHAIGGAGIGLLAASPDRAKNQRIGFVLLALSAALHLYAGVSPRRSRQRFLR